MTHDEFRLELELHKEHLEPDSFAYDNFTVMVQYSNLPSRNVYALECPRYGFLQGLSLFPEPSTPYMIAGMTTVNTNSIIYPRVDIGNCCTIGGPGFGYVEFNGRLHRMPHHGCVILFEDVKIGNNVCIDRAVLGETLIGPHTKIDNLVHVAHGAKIGKQCLIAAGAIIGGSAVIGDNCKIWIGAKIFNKVKIGDGATIGAGAVVRSDVGPGETWVGNPARKIK